MADIENLFDGITLEKVAFDKIHPNPMNPRVELRPGMPLYDKLKQSILGNSYLDPIIWNKRSGYIVAGHQRYAVLRDIAEESNQEIKEIPVIVVDLPEDKERTFLLASNKVQGIWDTEKLARLFQEMEDEDFEFTGFDDFEIASLVGESDEDVDMDDDNVFVGGDGNPKGFVVSLVCEDDDDKEWVKKILNVSGNLHRRYVVKDLNM